MIKEKLLTTTEISKYCSVTTETVANWIKSGKLKASVTPGKRYRIRVGDFIDFLNSLGMPIPDEFKDLSKKEKESGDTFPMFERILPKKNLQQFIDKLKEKAKIFAPIAKGKNFVFDEVSNAKKIRFDYITTIIPPKRFFIPSQETLLKFNVEKFNVEEIVPSKEEIILLGVHPCDMQGILRLDYAFSKGNPESIYLSRREKSTIIGVTCNPDEYCFCNSVGTNDSEKGFDLFFADIGQSFLVKILSDKGKKLIAQVETFDVTDIDRDEAKRAIARCSDLKGKQIETAVENLPLLCRNGESSPMWDDVGKKCLSCGTCNLVCPTCYCFDVRDDVELSFKQGVRERFWDSCQLEEFAQVATGESFREDRKNRQKHRFYRKYRYLMPEYGSPFCVGCGRCNRQCVAKINIVEIANELTKGIMV